jgi:flavin reductase (DIM6/NTAB) family NADH-FMN oxidoreductase RutF
MDLGEQAQVVAAAFEPAWFRRVLGHFPTGVAVVTSIGRDGPVGMAVGSFTSVSLDPPLVAFLPDRVSTSWPKIRATKRFCVNVLAADQEAVCRVFAQSGIDKFAHVDWSLSPGGLPTVAGALAWIECDLEAVHDAGDHFIVLGHVRQLDVAATVAPLVFFKGGYGRFAAHRARRGWRSWAGRSVPADISRILHRARSVSRPNGELRRNVRADR